MPNTSSFNEYYGHNEKDSGFRRNLFEASARNHSQTPLQVAGSMFDTSLDDRRQDERRVIFAPPDRFNQQKEESQSGL